MESEGATLQCRVPVQRKRGDERFHNGDTDLGFSILDFWQWSDSDLVGNANRGGLAEFIVARALGLDTHGVQNEWEAYDLSLGTIKIEVKSSAYVQSWPQRKFCTPCFSIAPRCAWNQDTGKLGTERRRHSDVYVFALLAHRDKETIDPLDLRQWEFYVVSTAKLNASYAIEGHPIKKSLGLGEIRSLGKRVSFGELKEVVEQIGRRFSATQQPRHTDQVNAVGRSNG